MRKNPVLLIENTKILFKNFSGVEGVYNPAGSRNFCVLLSDKDASRLSDDGWNIKYLKSRDENEPEQPYLKVKVSYAKFPPKIMLINDRGKTDLDEETVHILDWADIESVDLEISPSAWERHGKTGISAYLKSLYATLADNILEKKYRDVPDSAMSAMTDDDRT